MLRRLREVMAEPVSAQERLNKIVVLIAANMVAEVCSIYVLRVDGTLELYATEGLKPDAVHVTVLRQDEGLVGLVSSEAKSRFPGIPWRNPARLRNRVVHGYWSVDVEILHTTAVEQLGEFARLLRDALAALQQDT